MDLVLKDMLMVIPMLANSLKIGQMDKENIIIIMEISIKEVFQMA
jgi:hypothetical protein